MTSDKSKPLEFYGGSPVHSESGVDVSLLRENLGKSIEERWEENRRAALFADSRRPSSGSRRPAWPVRRMFDPERLVRHFAAHRVEVVVIDNFARIIHGAEAVTTDLDFCYRCTPENLVALANAVTAIRPRLRGGPAGLPFRFDPVTIQAGRNFALSTDYGSVTLLAQVPGVGSYEAALSQSVERELSGIVVHVLSLDGLIAAKKLAGSDTGQAHLLELYEIKKLRDTAR
jgi:hypothetical protein